MRIRPQLLGPLLAVVAWLGLGGTGCPSAGLELRQQLDRSRMAYDRGDVLTAYRLLRQEQSDEPGDAALAGAHERLLARVTRATEHLVERWLQRAERCRAAGDLPRALRYLDDLLEQLPVEDGLRRLVAGEAAPIRSELQRLRGERDRLLNEARRHFAHGDFEPALQLFLEARWLAREHQLDFDLRHERLLTECSRRAPGELETLVETDRPAAAEDDSVADAPGPKKPRPQPRRRLRPRPIRRTKPAPPATGRDADDPNAGPAETAYRRARKQLKAGKRVKALFSLRRALDHDPEHAQAQVYWKRLAPLRRSKVAEWMRSASEHFAREELDQAAPYYRRVLKLEPDNLRAKEGLQMYQRLEELKQKQR
jgi:tetratricopeptide (TPR) repeat protein